MAYKVFTNGSPLPASDLNTFLMNQSVMTFANSTARTAALPTPTEGMVTWLDDSNRLDVWNGSSWVLVNDNTASVPLSTVTATGDLIVGNGNASVTRLGIGTNGQVLSSNGTTATWTTLAVGGAQSWTSLASGSMPASTTLSITGFAARDKYFLRVRDGSTNTAGSFIQARFNSNSGSVYDFFGASNSYSIATANFSIPGLLGDISQTSIDLGNANTANANSQFDLALLVNGSQSSGNKMFQAICNFDTQGETGSRSVYGMGMFKSTTAITSIQIISSAGNFDQGTYELWGSD